MQVVEKSQNKDFVKVGSLWGKQDKNKNAFLSGSLDLDDLEVSEKTDKNGNLKQVIYLSIHKNNKTNPNQPDYICYQLVDKKDFIELDESSLNINDDDIPKF